MRVPISEIKVDICKDVEVLLLPIGDYAKIYEIDTAEADEFGEAPIQILESRRYEYEFSDPSYQFKSAWCIPSKKKKSGRGTIAPGNYVGTMELDITRDGINAKKFYLEVLATKFDADNDYDKSYREHYRKMLEEITDKCTELLMQSNSPINQYFEPNYDEAHRDVLYQKFSFVKSVINKPEFEEALLRIINSPKTTWVNKEERTDIRSFKRFTNKNVREMLRGENRMAIPKTHKLSAQLGCIPTKINNYRQEPSLDNAENRFVKHALRVYLQFCEQCSDAFEQNSKDQKEANYIAEKLENYLNHSFFKNISRPTTLKLNSPTLQRKGGYREILRSWLMFDLASKLTWGGGEDVYKAGKRDIATLYEYWLFFVLYDLFKEKFTLNELSHDDKPYSHLFDTTENGINLIIKSGSHTALKGSKFIKNRAMNFKFSFNRTFSANKNSYPKAGSWTTALRPDYTLTVWPKELSEPKAEEQELIVHIHFDAKYKVNHFYIKTNDSTQHISKEKEREVLDEQKKEERAGVYKNADLLKMHAYKDAIRRTGGAYILYPGDTPVNFKGFHEIIPGLGAFAVNPNDELNHVNELSEFIDKVVDHLVDRASQRENIATKTHQITRGGLSDLLHEALPEYLNEEKLIPDETYVLVGYCKSKKHHDWYLENGLYNFRMNDEDGSLVFDDRVVNAKYLLLRYEGKANEMYRIIGKGVKVFSKAKLISMKYPQANRDEYLIIEIDKESTKELGDFEWNYKELKGYKEAIEKHKFIRKHAGIPFTTTLTELLKTRVLINIDANEHNQ